VGDEDEGEHEAHACPNAHRMPANTPVTSDAGAKTRRDSA
jgi:hypothetical protein